MLGAETDRPETGAPALIATALRWSWKASPRDTLLTVGLNIAAGAFSAIVLTAVVGILQGLFAQNPTPERLQAALPSLLLAGAATLTRAALRSAAIWAQGRLTPMVERAVEVELVSLTTATRLEAFDDSDWCDQIHRARTLGVYEAGRITGYAADIATELVSLLAVATVVTVLHPVLLPLLALTVAPVGWAAIRSARMRYARMRALSTANRLLYMYTHAMTERDSAAELRAYAMRPMLLAEFARISDHVRDALLAVVGRQTTTRAVGDVLGGIATLATYAALVALLLAGLMPLAVAGAAYLALGQGKAALDRLMSAVNSCYESGLCAGVQGGGGRARPRCWGSSGHYTHHVVSMHVNDADAHRMKRIVDANPSSAPGGAPFAPAEMPGDTSWDDIATVLAQEAGLRANAIDHDPASVTTLGLAPYWQRIVLLLEAYRQLRHTTAPMHPQVLQELDPGHRWLLARRWPHRMPTETT